MIWMMIIFMKLIQYNCLCSNQVSFDDDVVDGDLDDDSGHAITADDHDGVGASFGAADDDIHLHCEGVYEVASLAEVQAVQPYEPVGGWDQFCQQRDLVMMIILVQVLRQITHSNTNISDILKIFTLQMSEAKSNVVIQILVQQS